MKSIILVFLMFFMTGVSYSSDYSDVGTSDERSYYLVRELNESRVPTMWELQMVEHQIISCSRKVKNIAKPDFVLAVLRWEERVGVPQGLRGIFGAIWCWESGMRIKSRRGGPIRGDRRGKVWMAHGPVQIWPWQRKWCGMPNGGADNLFISLECYWKRVQDRYEARIVRSGWNCREPWRVAEALTANGPKYLKQKCKAKSHHWTEWEKWMRKF